jgi:FKBP-type peptidyl-prolyl cis-trans isomerase 2
MPLQKSDFIEVEFTGKIKDGDVFDSNIKEDLAKLNSKTEVKPFVFCLGQDMFLKGVEDYLIGKDLGEYNIELTADKAFGKRDPKLIQKMPSKVFQEQKLNPVPGAAFNFDGRIGKVLTVSGGRVMVDFNNPLAGRDVVYKINVKRKVTNQAEQVKALNDFLFRKELKFEIKDKTLILHVEKVMKPFAEAFKAKYKEMLGLELKVEEVEKETPEKTTKTTQ